MIYTLFVCLACSNASKTRSKGSVNRKVPDSSGTHSISDKQQNCDSLREKLSKTELGNFGKITRIPDNIEESLLQLDTLTNPPIREWIRCLPDGDFSGSVHHGFGMYLRNNWGLWQDSKLARNLYNMGILHPDDMTAIILTSYQRKLKGEDIQLDEQLKYYQDFWRKSGMPVDSILEANKKKNGD
jgi:hypothetical protein